MFSLKFSSLSFGISSYSRFKVSSLRCFKFSSLSYGIKFKSLRGSFSVHKIKCSFSNLFRIQSQVFFHWCFGIKPGTSYLKSQDLLNSKSRYQIIQFLPYASCQKFLSPVLLLQCLSLLIFHLLISTYIICFSLHHLTSMLYFPRTHICSLHFAKTPMTT